ncbi:single-stranded DNA-binding protein [Dyella soli]|uniref:Uncharacterized protein n=1 Tax=Dyella soli TaxID=522319 RepID=A0A4R0YQF4_9GAMM|nr:single-stranded DNA-binding protein [Dyella soli]TCI10135.1 hypothetical protein EZM97_14545 [Dyella soli]
MKIQVLNRAAEQVQTTWEGVTRERSKQWCLLEIDGLPTSFQITVDPGKEYAPGEYTLAPESFAVSNGRLTMSRAVLVPVIAQVKQQPKPAAA